jgi:stage II sporulation protein D (peptidoglycan lytic transglycosylase)
MSRVLIAIILIICLISAVIWYEKSGNEDGSISSAGISEKLQKYSKSSFNPEIRVHLTTRKSISFKIPSAYEVRSIKSQKVLSSGKKLSQTTIKHSQNKLWIGKKKYGSKGIEISVRKSPAIWINKHCYHGKIRLYPKSNGRVEVVNVVPMRNYIASVTDSEMPGNFPYEARAAQAIIARTYALYQMEQASNKSSFDLYSSTRSQKYLGYQYRDKRGRLLAGESPSSRKISEQTAGMVCTHRGDLFCTYYSAVCGGKSDEGKTVFKDAAPPLKSVVCEWCKDARYFQWNASMDRATFNRALLKFLRKKGMKLRVIQTVKSTTSLDYFTVSDGKKSIKIKTRELKPYLLSAHLLSPKYFVQPGSQKVNFRGFGHGHCVGFCQWGSRGLAQAGKSTKAILQYYYPGSQLVNLTGKTEMASRK